MINPSKKERKKPYFPVWIPCSREPLWMHVDSNIRQTRDHLVPKQAPRVAQPGLYKEERKKGGSRGERDDDSVFGCKMVQCKQAKDGLQI
jgi:hypothetical protein